MFQVPETPVAVALPSSCVKVYARTRPLLQQEVNRSAKNIIRVLTNEKQIAVEDTNEKFFKFESVFHETTTQEEVYSSAVAPLVVKVADGQKATVLAYGQTGSGKTFSMGTDPCTAKEDEGILQRSMSELLQRIKDDDWPPGKDPKHLLTISFLEVYNEVIYDLLAPSRIPVKTKNGYGGAVSPVGMVEEKVSSVEEGLKLLERGSHHRSVASTALNQHSSRSHALIYITMQIGVKRGCLILVDLAGAEGVGRAQTSGLQLMEGIHINKGLLTLGKVLSALSNPAAGYVPYRESILTRLLKDSLGGSSHTAMIACLNPASDNLHETINTLRYAEQAQNIKMKPQVFSTIKRFGIKRRCEDVTATPGAWKRRAMTSCKKKDHNTTVSTPGHKPAKRTLPLFNNTFGTPSSRANDLTLNSSLFSAQNFPQPCPSIALTQPIFEDDSPLKFSTTSTMENPDSQPSTFSPYMDRMTNRLEQSIMSHFESIEDRVADRIINRLKKSKKGRRSRRSVNRMNSTPTDEGKNSDSSDDSLTSVTMALLGGAAGKNVFKKLITGVLKDVQSQNQSSGFKRLSKEGKVQEETRYSRKPLGDVSNVIRSDSTIVTNDIAVSHRNTEVAFSDIKMASHPLTSTTFNDKRHVRKSTRLSTKRSIHNAIYEKVSPLYQRDAFSPSLFSDSTPEDPTTQNETVMPQIGASPLLQSRISLKHDNLSDMEDTMIYSGILELPTTCPTFDVKNETVKEKLDCCSSSPLQIDRISKKMTTQKISGAAILRRSTRMSAIKATQKNYEIFTGCSPATSLCKKQKANTTFNMKKGSSQNVTVHVVPDGNTTLSSKEKSKWKLVMSPGQQEDYCSEIQKILNSGTVRQLQQLPTIGPKTAMIIYNYRLMFGKFSSVEDISKIPALPKSFYMRFMKANLMNRLSFDI